MAKRKRKRTPPKPAKPVPAASPPSTPRRSRRLATMSLLAAGFLLLAGWLVLGRTSGGPEAPATDPERSAADHGPASSGHLRMLAALRAIQAETDDLNLWQGRRPLDVALSRLQRLAPDAGAVERHDRLEEAGYHELRMGNEEEAIRYYQAAYDLLPQIGDEIGPEAAARTTFRLAVAHLRHGETRNCALQHAGESCILPIRGKGIHTDPEGSRQAIHYFRQVLEHTPLDHPIHLKAVWLYNLAHMTVGEYPAGVPEPYRIPVEVFDSGARFPRFENVAPELGLDTFDLFGGALTDDFDGDGWLDILTTTFDTSGQMRFFHNERDGSFADRTHAAGLDGLFGGLNLVQADYDNDGDLDVYILRGAWLSVAGRHPNSLLRNDGDGAFTDVTFDAGLGEVSYPTQTAAWADYDNDGDVDLFVGNEHGESYFDGPCQLFRNEGDGTFVDVAHQAGVDHRAFVKGVVWGDVDNDRFPDLYLSVLGGRNLLYHNDGDGTFTDVAAEAGVDGPSDSFPVWFWDFDNDGALDLFVPTYRGVIDGVAAVAATNFGMSPPIEPPALYRGDGHGHFRDVAAEQGLVRIHMPMGANFGDLDGDGWLDFYLGTGYPDYEALMPNVMYRNRGGRGFEDVTWAGGFGHLQKGHGISFFDYDHDGDLDVFAQMGGAFPGDRAADALYRNPGFGNGWIALRLEGTRSNRAALGTRLRLDITEGDTHRSLYRTITSGGSFGSSPLRQTIGLGGAHAVERLEVYWPTSDLTQTFTAVEGERFYRIVEGQDELLTDEPAPAAGEEKS